jgi:hypothetical protein
VEIARTLGIQLIDLASTGLEPPRD